MPRQDASRCIKELAGISLLATGFIMANRKLNAKSIHKIVQVEGTMTINTADGRAGRTDNSGLFLNERINGSDQLAHLDRRASGLPYRR